MVTTNKMAFEITDADNKYLYLLVITNFILQVFWATE